MLSLCSLEENEFYLFYVTFEISRETECLLFFSANRGRVIFHKISKSYLVFISKIWYWFKKGCTIIRINPNANIMSFKIHKISMRKNNFIIIIILILQAHANYLKIIMKTI